MKRPVVDHRRDPEHKRYRALVNAVFASGRVSHKEDTIGALIDELIDDFVEAGEVDFVDRFAVLLPTYIIADILGLPRDKYDKVKHWSDAVITFVGRMGTREQKNEAAHQMVEFRRYIKETVAGRRIDPRDDLISNLVTVRLDGVTPLDDDEAAAFAFECSVTGYETTRNTLISCMVQLLRHVADRAARYRTGTRVRGVHGLRVVDCSIMPGLISGNTNGPAMATGWRAADLILEDRALRNAA